MSQYEKYAWASLVAWGLILYFLLTRVSVGLDAVVAQFGPSVQQPAALTLLGNYLFIGVLAAIAETVIQLTLILPKGGSDLRKDERDRAIDARAHLTSYWFTAVAINIVLIHALATAAFGVEPMGRLHVESVVDVAFLLLAILVAAETVQRLALVVQYRTG